MVLLFDMAAILSCCSFSCRSFWKAPVPAAKLLKVKVRAKRVVSGSPCRQVKEQSCCYCFDYMCLGAALAGSEQWKLAERAEMLLIVKFAAPAARETSVRWGTAEKVSVYL